MRKVKYVVQVSTYGVNYIKDTVTYAISVRGEGWKKYMPPSQKITQSTYPN